MAMEIACDMAYLALWSLLTVIAVTANAHWMFTAAFLIAACAARGCLTLTRQGNTEGGAEQLASISRPKGAKS